MAKLYLDDLLVALDALHLAFSQETFTGHREEQTAEYRAPAGYVGSKAGNTLFARETIAGSSGKPDIATLDELDIANQPATRALMSILDNRQLRLSCSTSRLDFHNGLIFMASNVRILSRKSRARY